MKKLSVIMVLLGFWTALAATGLPENAAFGVKMLVGLAGATLMLAGYTLSEHPVRPRISRASAANRRSVALAPAQPYARRKKNTATLVSHHRQPFGSSAAVI